MDYPPLFLLGASFFGRCQFLTPPIVLHARTQISEGKRLSREEWLVKGLDFVGQRGGEALRIDQLVRSVGVTTGSFYWHFASRSEFVEAVAEYFDKWANRRVVEAVDAHAGSPEEKLRFLMAFVFKADAGRFDRAMRAWAAQEKPIAKAVARSDAFRLRYVLSLFRKMGFGEAEAQLRARLFTGYICGEIVLADRWERKKQLATVDERVAFFVRR